MFINNWGGVVLYENADRYCGSAGNSSTGYCTLVDPSVATLGKCTKPSLIGTNPYYNDCRWKTQNVLVKGNYFAFDPTKIGPECTSDKYCGFNGVFSAWGSCGRTRVPPLKIILRSIRTTISCRIAITARGSLWWRNRVTR